MMDLYINELSLIFVIKEDFRYQICTPLVLLIFLLIKKSVKSNLLYGNMVYYLLCIRLT